MADKGAKIQIKMQKFLRADFGLAKGEGEINFWLMKDSLLANF